MSTRDSRGFTLVELLVALFIFAVISGTFYALLLSGVQGGDTARDVTRVSEEARLGFNRMVRDVREAERLTAASPDDSSFTIRIDFNRDGDTNDSGEEETFAYLPDRTITVNGEVLMEGVRPIGTRPIFDFSSNFLQFDTSGDGVATWQEIHAAEDVGTLDLDFPELPYLSNITFSLRVTSGERTTSFFTEAQLRNQR